MLEGTAGSGKTTLMKHVCHQWAEGKLLHHVDLLIHLTLADPTLWSASSLEDMIPHPTSVEIRRAVAENIIERGGKGCCFILDGWEDLPEEMHTSSVIHDLLKGSQPGVALPHCSFIVTTRPIASPSLQPLITTTVEITGFSAESVDTYASQCLIQQGKDPAVFVTTLNDNHHARGLCSLPINAAILLHLFLTIQTGLPTTQTELFNCFILNLLLRHLVTKTGHKHAKPLLRCFSNLPSNEKLAFNNNGALLFTLQRYPNTLKTGKNWRLISALLRQKSRRYEATTLTSTRYRNARCSGNGPGSWEIGQPTVN